MKSYTITHDQLIALEYALTLAQYFVDDQEPSNACHKGDTDTLNRAYEALAQIMRSNS